MQRRAAITESGYKSVSAYKRAQKRPHSPRARRSPERISSREVTLESLVRDVSRLKDKAQVEQLHAELKQLVDNGAVDARVRRYVLSIEADLGNAIAHRGEDFEFRVRSAKDLATALLDYFKGIPHTPGVGELAVRSLLWEVSRLGLDSTAADFAELLAGLTDLIVSGDVADLMQYERAEEPFADVVDDVKAYLAMANNPDYSETEMTEFITDAAISAEAALKLLILPFAVEGSDEEGTETEVEGGESSDESWD